MSPPAQHRKDLSWLTWIVRSDLWRHAGAASFALFSFHYRRTPGFRYMCWHRLYALAASTPWARFGLRQFVSWRLRRLSVLFGISIPSGTRIGPGFYIGHYGGIVVHPEVVIGRNCNLSHDVTIGLASRGPRFGTPRIGDDVYIGPGAKIFGAIQIGDRVAVGANAVVNRDVPADSTVVGVPGVVRQGRGSEGYITQVDY